MEGNGVAGLVLEAWNDFDRVVGGLDERDAGVQPEGQSSIAWALGHVTEHVDRLINATLQGRDRHPLLGSERFRMGSAGEAEDWRAIQAATREVRDAARPYLERVTDADLDRRHEFPGRISSQLGPLTLRYALLRIGGHHYFHIGVIACQRDRMGHSVGDYPGLMAECQ
jgi:hypothetical protein